MDGQQHLPGWYPDPSDSAVLRWWDGSAWSEHTAPRPQEEPVPVAPSDAPAPGEAQVPLLGARKLARDLQSENARLRRVIDRYGIDDAVALEARKAQLLGEIMAAEGRLNEVLLRTQASERERERIEQDTVDLRGVASLQESGLFDYEHIAESSVELSTELESVRSAIKAAVQNGQATSALSAFTFNNSAAQGRKFVKDMSKLLLRAYNAEAENCVKTVRAGNLAAAQKRLNTARDQIQRSGSMISMTITDYYHWHRLKELELASRHLQALQAEKELERARREELREQRKAEQELAREKERLEKERSHYLNVLASLEAGGDAEGAARMRSQLEDVDRAIADVDYRTANIRAGYVYVISNLGSFGPDVVKIGLTRRLEPMDRVNELGDASVPFRFDVHALFFAPDAVSVENLLHQHFAERRLNKVNLRREFFRATPSEVLDVLRAHEVEVLEFTVEPDAAEYRSGVAVAAAVPSEEA